MTTYRIYYMRPEAFRDFGGGFKTPRREDLEKTHVHLIDREVSAIGRMDRLNAVFREMQAENWSPNGEQRDLIRSKGLSHTSMSVGDVIEDETGAFWVVANIGFVPV